ncbi:hypothetical protein [Pseudomonas lactis]|uniref:hypothetical protein n=1 Tax=Pseudomonas lactis TaxID=1615674 RepID=UPI003F81E158
MNIENISKYLAAIPTLFLCVLMTSLSAFSFTSFILKILDNPLSIFTISLMSFGIIVTFIMLLFLLEAFQEIFVKIFFYIYVFIIGLCFILRILESPLFIFNTAFICIGLMSTFTIMLLSLDIFQKLFTTIIYYFLVFLAQSAALIKEIAKKIKHLKKQRVQNE